MTYGSACGLSSNVAYKKINKTDLPLINYTSFGDILSSVAPIYPLNLGAYGEYNSFYAFGALPNRINAQFNGRNIFNRNLLSTNLENIAPEYFENAELFIGSDACVLGDNSSGLLVNLQEIRYNTKAPYTKIWYSQAGGEQISADAIYSQNVRKDLNIAFGLRSRSAKNAYDNSAYDSWNIRGGLRWNPDKYTSLSITEIFNHAYIENNGGVAKNSDGDIFDDILSKLNYYGAREREFRHDLTAKYYSEFSKDSKSALDLTLYFSNSKFENNRDTSMLYMPKDTVTGQKYEDMYWGAKGVYDYKPFESFSSKFGADIMMYSATRIARHPSNDGLKTSFFARIENKFSSKLIFSAGGRFSFYEDKAYSDYGAKLSYKSDSSFSIFGDISFSESLPNDFELKLKRKENDLLAIIQSDFRINSSEFSVNAYYRITNNPILYRGLYSKSSLIDVEPYQENKREAIGLSFAWQDRIFSMFKYKIWNISQISFINGNNEKLLPAAYFGADISYTRVFGRSQAWLGIKAKYATRSKDYTYVPIHRTYIANDEFSASGMRGVDLYATARLSTAYVKITLENLLGDNYYYTAYYPMPGRNLRISIHWDFMN
jgi:hypothetical protein